MLKWDAIFPFRVRWTQSQEDKEERYTHKQKNRIVRRSHFRIASRLRVSVVEVVKFRKRSSNSGFGQKQRRFSRAPRNCRRRLRIPREKGSSFSPERTDERIFYVFSARKNKQGRRGGRTPN